MSKKSLTDQSSIYQYTLLRKIRITPLIRVLYIVLLTGCLMFLLSRPSFEICLLILTVVQVLQLLFKWMILHWIYPVLANRWSFSLRFPFIGLVPQQPVLYANYRSSELLTALAGLLLIGSVVVWLPMASVASILCFLLMLQLPSVTVLLFRVKAKQSNSVWVKLQPSDISYYRA